MRLTQTSSTVRVRRACREDSTKMQPCLTHRDGEHVLHREVNEAFGGASARWTRWIQIAGGMVMSCQDQSVVPTVCEHQRELTTKKAGRCKDTTAQLGRSENSWTCPICQQSWIESKQIGRGCSPDIAMRETSNENISRAPR